MANAGDVRARPDRLRDDVTLWRAASRLRADDERSRAATLQQLGDLPRENSRLRREFIAIAHRPVAVRQREANRAGPGTFAHANRRGHGTQARIAFAETPGDAVHPSHAD